RHTNDHAAIERAGGLRNLGNTCYMNAAVQALLALTRYVDDMQCEHWIQAVLAGEAEAPPPPPDVSDGRGDRGGGENGGGGGGGSGGGRSSDRQIVVVGKGRADAALASAKGGGKGGGSSPPSASLYLALLQLSLAARGGPGGAAPDPALLKLAVDRHTDRFVGNRQQDAHEFLTELVSTLDEELEPFVPAVERRIVVAAAVTNVDAAARADATTDSAAANGAAGAGATGAAGAAAWVVVATPTACAPDGAAAATGFAADAPAIYLSQKRYDGDAVLPAAVLETPGIAARDEATAGAAVSGAGWAGDGTLALVTPAEPRVRPGPASGGGAASAAGAASGYSLAKTEDEEADEAANAKKAAEEEAVEATARLRRELLPTARAFHAEVDVTLTCACCGYSRIRTEFYRDFSLDVDDAAAGGSVAGGTAALATSGAPLFGESGVSSATAAASAVPLQRLLTSFFRPRELSLRCERCRSERVRAEYSFGALPRVLVLHVKRFR
ncbi:unnamed protein product, partial [Phaeothamnion confervicola]